MFENGVVREAQFGEVGMHQPVLDYLYLSVGSASPRWADFHGQWSQLTLKLGRGAFLDQFSGQQLSVPQYPQLEDGSFKIIEAVESEFSGEEFPIEHSSQQTEYAVELWLRWVYTSERVPLESIYVLSYGTAGNNVKAGDRVLSLFQDRSHNLLFSSYTTVVDRFEKIASDCLVSDLAEQASWMYAYFGYSRAENSLTYLLETRSRDCFGRMQASHRVPDSLSLKYGADGFNSAFHGKLAYLAVHVGRDTYKKEASAIKLSECHMSGNELQPATIEWKELASERLVLDHSKDNQLAEEFLDRDDMNMDGQEHYGFGFWSKFLHAYPSRIENVPALISVARLTSNKQYSD